MKVLITAGPTAEPLDPVRFLSNRSSGKMGYALAIAAQKQGWETYLVSGPVDLAWPVGVEGEIVQTAQEMFEAVTRKQKQQDLIVMCAAVADYRPKNYIQEKRKKTSDTWHVELVKTKDILSFIGHNRYGDQLIVGFCLETENLIEQAKLKLENKKVDVIVANDARAMEADNTVLFWVDAKGHEYKLEEMSKLQAAEEIISLLTAYKEDGSHA